MEFVRPDESSYIWIVQSSCGRDRKRYFIAFDHPAASRENGFPAVYTVNGALHPVEKPKKKHIAHLRIVKELEPAEKAQLLTDYSNKTAAILIQKYDEYGELSENREKTEDFT